MADTLFMVLDGGKRKAKSSASNEFDFSSIRIGASNLVISENAGAFDFQAKNIVNVGTVDGRDISADGTTLDSHLDGGASKHDASEIDFEYADGSKKTIQAASDDVESALIDLDSGMGDVAGLGTPTFYSTSSESEIAARLAGIDTALGVANVNEFKDDVFRVVDQVDNSKKIAFESSGIATASVRTITMPDFNVDLADVSSNTTAVGNAQTEINDLESALGAMISVSGSYVAHSGSNYMDGNANVTQDLLDLDSQVKTNADAISALVSTGMDFKGNLDASLLGSQLDNAQKGDYFVVNVAGTIFGLNAIALNVGDTLIAKVDITGTPNDGADWVKIDNTEAADILRKGQLASAQLFVGNGSGEATAVSLSGDVTMSNAGVVAIGTGKVLNDMLAGSISDSKLASDYVQVSEVDGSSIEWSGTQLQVKALGIATSMLADDSVTKAKLNSDVVAGSLVKGLRQAADGSLERHDFLSMSNDNAGTITARQIVYIKSNGNVDLAQANAIATSEGKLGVVESSSIAAAASGEINLRHGAIIEGFSTLTPGLPVFLSNSVAGSVTQTAPTSGVSRQIGEAFSATGIIFDPQDAIEIL